jgi:hypothetical protein
MAVDYSKEIARLEQMINGGVSSVTVDGLTTTINIDDARARLAELKRLQGDTNAKRRVSSLNLGGCW